MTIQDQIQTNLKLHFIPVPIKILETEMFQIIDLETLHTIAIENIPTIGIETIQTIETLDIKNAIILTTDQNTITIKIDHATIHRKEVQAITIDKGITLNHHIEITLVIKNSQQNYRSNKSKSQRQKNQVQSTEETKPDPLVLKTTKAQNCN